ncbi:hypothetical protein CEP50_18860, partial [Actinopolyspora mortivallis]
MREEDVIRGTGVRVVSVVLFAVGAFLLVALSVVVLVVRVNRSRSQGYTFRRPSPYQLGAQRPAGHSVSAPSGGVVPPPPPPGGGGGCAPGGG